jgi:hypothetical protein
MKALGKERPTEVRVGRGKASTFEMCGPGKIINVNYGPKTKDWESFIADIYRGASFNVLAVINGDKFEIRNGQTMWPVETFHEMTRPPKSLEEPDFDDAEDDAEPMTAAPGV